MNDEINLRKLEGSKVKKASKLKNYNVVIINITEIGKLDDKL